LVEDLQGHLAATVWLIWFLHADIPEGIMTDIESSFLNGWTCYLEEPYHENEDVAISLPFLSKPILHLSCFCVFAFLNDLPRCD
jgi:hypothetical protein